MEREGRGEGQRRGIDLHGKRTMRDKSEKQVSSSCEKYKCKLFTL